MELILSWWTIVSQLQTAFTRKKTFYWAVIVVMGFCTRDDSLGGVTSFIRCLRFKPKYYQRILHFFQSSAIKLDQLIRCWVKVVLQQFRPLLVNGRVVYLIDGIAIPKEGLKMPGVQCLHQSSGSNSKAEYIRGHFFQCIGVLAGIPGKTLFSIPLFGKIHLGTKTTNRDKRTLFDKAMGMLKLYVQEQDFYLIGDAYYSVGKMLKGVTAMGGDFIVRVKTNAVAWFPPKMEK